MRFRRGIMAGERKHNPRATTALDREIGRRIRARRLERDMSQQELAAAIKITFQQIQKYEKGVNRVSAATLVDIARTLETPLTSLVPVDADAHAVREAPLASDATALKFLPLVSNLNADGQRVLASIARALAKDPKLARR